MPRMSLIISDETLHAAHLTEAELEQELAILLFEQDRITLVQAAALAKMRPLPFQHLLASRGIGPHYDVPEFEQDLRTLSSHGPT
jgi:predicted HTH domain antitoxin